MRIPKFCFVVTAVLFSTLIMALPATAGTYATCIACHALPLTQALGQLGPHPSGPSIMIYPPPPPENQCSGCHAPNHVYGRRYFWNWPIQTAPPAAIKQMCQDCHDGINAPIPHSSHPNDIIPYSSNSRGLTAPTSILPLYSWDGAFYPVGNPGGMVCSTCHDPHQPASIIADGKQGFLRVGNGTTDTASLCLYCHSDIGPLTSGWELTVPSDGLAGMGVSLQTTTTTNQHLLRISIKNRGNQPYPGGSFDVTVEDNAGSTFPVGTGTIPTIPPGSLGLASIDWNASGWSGQAIFHIPLPVSSLNPARSYEFVKSFNLDLDPPLNLSVTAVGSSSISLTWAPPADATPPITYNVYRNGLKISSTGTTTYTDANLAPETPHTYAVEAVDSLGGVSPMSNRVGATTTYDRILRVPGDYPTIFDAINAATPGTSIHVAAGTYRDPVTLYLKNRVTILGDDPNACVLYPGVMGPDLYSPSGVNSIGRFTIINSVANARAGDTLFSCVFKNTSGAAASLNGGGSVINCTFDTAASAPSVSLSPGQTFSAVNTIFGTNSTTPILRDTTVNPAGVIYLLHNDFRVSGTWTSLPGEGNFIADPLFVNGYQLANGSPCIGTGVPVGMTSAGLAPDIGAFEFSIIYAPRPPSDLGATLIYQPQSVHLQWAASPDPGILAYHIYRAVSPVWQPLPEPPYAVVAADQTSFEDLLVTPRQTYVYQVRAYAGESSGRTLLSAQGDSVPVYINSAPVPVNDTVTVFENGFANIAVLSNDTDPDGDTLTVSSITPAAHGTATLMPGNTVVSYIPAAGYSGPDQFTYTVSDGRSGTASASVFITVVHVNRSPVAVTDTAATKAFTPVDIPVLANDTDPDGDPITLVGIFSVPNSGQATVNPDGKTIRYLPTGSFVGADSFRYSINDGQGGTATGTVNVTVAAVKMRTAIYLRTSTYLDNTVAVAEVTVKDEAGRPLSGVSLAGRWSGLTSGVQYYPTAPDGKAIFVSSTVRRANGTFTFTIESATLAGYLLDSGGELTKSLRYPPGAGKMHVASIDMTASVRKTTTATATVMVLDEGETTVAGATVQGSWSGAVSGTATAVTSTTGYAKLTSPAVKSAPGQVFTFTVTGIVKTGWTYDPAANHVISGSIAP